MALGKPDKGGRLLRLVGWAALLLAGAYLAWWVVALVYWNFTGKTL